MRTMAAATVLFSILAAMATGAAPAQAPSEHREFDATLEAPYRAPPGGQRSFALHFAYPGAPREQAVTWRLELRGPSGRPLQRWFGVERLLGRPVTVRIPWDARSGGAALPDGTYQLRLRALSHDRAAAAADAALAAAGLAADPEGLVEQRWDILVGNPAPPAMPAFRALPGRAGAAAAPAPAALPFTVYYGNLHSQTNHSDGGADVAHCAGAQHPQSGAFGPAAAYDFARGRGLDILVTSEHNHMYDGSDGTDGNADPAAAQALYRAGLAQAREFNAGHPDFVAIYGQEWGVINNGGHLNIFNSEELLGWERNERQQLLADTHTPKNDYAALFALMRERGWIGQFNHPAPSGQFRVGGAPFGYSRDGDEAMALCEVMNSSAFSTNITETENRRSNYELACNKALEAGYHVAFSSNQDNHCANWGASYTNRTGLLIRNDVPLSQASVFEAMKARRVFATMDKESQLVLTANGHLMGERFDNSGPLRLLVHHANPAGRRVAAVAVFEGVPGRNGAATQLSAGADTTITPTEGEHYYYAKVTQDDGKVLWSAPVWVNQRGCP
jgi:hypothetical protein